MPREMMEVIEEENEINLTPMLDVVFIMLIFFIVTASFIKESGIDVNKPEAMTERTVDDAGILVAIDENSDIWITLETEEQLIVDPPTPPRPDPPQIPPTIEPHQPFDDVGIGFRPFDAPAPRPAGGPTFKRLNFGDGPLVSIIKVRPQYPTRAAAKGLEGTVLVQYDVTTMGTVENVVVIETSNSIFNKAAIAAAYRFKYKPGMVDGVAYETRGLRNLFRFEMEK